MNWRLNCETNNSQRNWEEKVLNFLPIRTFQYKVSLPTIIRQISLVILVYISIDFEKERVWRTVLPF